MHLEHFETKSTRLALDYVVGLISEMVLHSPVVGFLEDVTHNKTTHRR